MKRRVIGLTGGIATGKSTVLELFRQKGIPVLSADVLARDCVAPGKPAYRAVLRHFWFRVSPSRTERLDRKKLGRLICSNIKPSAVRLEKIIHPCVIRAQESFYPSTFRGLMVLDIPLLYEAKLENLVDEVVVVYATQAQQIARLMARNELSRAEALQRIRAQWPLREKCRRADYILRNNGSLKQLQHALFLYLKTLGVQNTH